MVPLADAVIFGVVVVAHGAFLLKLVRGKNPKTKATGSTTIKGRVTFGTPNVWDREYFENIEKTRTRVLG